MSKKPTYEELEETVKGLEKEIAEYKQIEKALQKAYDELEWQVEERAGELMAINKQLQQEIIERQEVQEQLALFHQFVEASREGMGWADLDGRVRYINPTLSRMFGEKKPEDSYGRPVLEYYSEETQRRLQEEIFPTVLREGTWMGELVIHSSTGSLIPTTNSLIVLRDAEGNPSSFANVLTDLTERKRAEDELRRHRDHLEEIVSERTNSLKHSNQKLQQEITERKQAEEALLESETKYSTLVESSNDGIIMISDGVLSFVNKTSIELVGYAPEEMIGANFLNFVATDYRELVLKRYADRMEGKDVPAIYEIELLRKDGKTIPVELNAIRIDFKDKPADLVLIRDITKRKQAEMELRESVSMRRGIFMTTPVGVTVVKDRTFIYANNQFCNIVGYNEEELIGNTTRMLYESEEEWVRVGSELYTHLWDQGFARAETQHLRKDGKIRDIVLRAAPVLPDDASAGVVFAIEDVTDRKLAEEEKKKMEAQLQQAQKMESMGTLAGGIAHDFNNLLMGIQGRTSLMLMDSDSSHPYLEHLKGIEDYVKSAADLTKQLLGFARGGKYEIKPTDLNELILNENRMFGRTRKEINIQEKIEENLWTVEVDRRQIEQVLLNIYVNAWQAMPGGGDLYIQTENTIIDENYSKPYQVEPGRYVKISITDTGVGMDEATQERIFDPFFTTKGIGRGTGLGLASAYGIIKNHSGFINVYSEKGEGTTFNIYLLASEKEAVKKEELHEELFRGTETLLLVDDEDMIVDVGCEIIEKLGYQALTARSGKEAIGIYEKNQGQIDMVILDMIMPDMGGGETYDKLKEINPDIKVLLSSGYSINGRASEILDRGCNGFIQKPFNIADLSKKIREVLERDRYGTRR